MGTVGGMCSVSVHSSLRFSFSPQTDSQAEIAHRVKERERGRCLKGGQFSNEKHFLVWGRSREGTSFILFYFTVFLFSWVSGSIDILKGVQFFKIHFLMLHGCVRLVGGLEEEDKSDQAREGSYGYCVKALI